MASTIKIKNSSTASAVPTSSDLVQGELAVNVTDKRIFTENASGTVVELGINPSSLTMTGGTANGVAYLNGSKVVTSGSALQFDGTTLKNAQSSSGATPSSNGNGLVLDSSGNGGLTIATGASSLGNIFFADSGDSADGFVQYDQSGRSLRFGTATAEKMRLDSSGNLGLGVTPSAWSLSGSSALQVKGASVLGYQNNSYIQSNAYFNSSWKYINDDFAQQYIQATGQHQWYTAPSGTAGNAITFTQAMTLDASGNLGLGVTPSAWNSANKVLQFAYAGTVAGGTTLDLYCNAYVNSGGTSKYIDSYAYASKYTQYNGAHQWHNTTSTQGAGNTVTWSQAMTLDASGNLGIGVTSPTDTINFGRIIDVASSSLGGGTYYRNSGTAYYAAVGYDGSNGYIGTWGASAGPLRIYTNSTERARIDSSGNLLVGQTATGYQNSNSFVLQPTTGYMLYSHANGTSSGTAFMGFGYNGGGIGTITQNGTTGVLYNTSSDYRLKDITGSLTGYKERLSALQPKQGSWKADGSEFRGFLAHEFAESYPASVSGEKDAVDADGNPQHQGMQAGSPEVIADLVAYIKELETRLAALEA